MNERSILVGGPPPADPEQSNRPGLRWWAVGATGLAIGLGVGLAFAPGSSPTTTTTSTGSEVGAPEATTSSETAPLPRSQRLGTQVPGMVDALVVVSADPAGNSEVSVWPAADRRPAAKGLPSGVMLADAAHRWLATVTRGRFTVGGSLWIGDETYMEPLAVDVSGAVWHAESSGRIAWTGVEDAGTILMVADLRPGIAATPVPVTAVAEGAGVVWWTDAGLIVAGEQTLTAIQPSGEVVRSLPEVEGFVAGGERVAAVVAGGTAALADAGLTSLVPAPWEASCFDGSMFGEMLALLCPASDDAAWPLEVQVWSVPSAASPELVHTIRGPSLLPPTWTPDGRFVVVPSIDPFQVSTVLTFYSPADDAAHTAVFPGRIQGLQTMRSS